MNKFKKSFVSFVDLLSGISYLASDLASMLYENKDREMLVFTDKNILLKVVFKGETTGCVNELRCLILQIDDKVISEEEQEEKGVKKVWDGDENMNADALQFELFSLALEKFGIKVNKLASVSEKFARGHLRRLELKKSLL